MRYPATLLAACLVLVSSCTKRKARLEGKWISQSENEYHYWKSGILSRSFEPFPIVGKIRMEITADSIFYLDNKSLQHPWYLRRSYTRQDTMIFIHGNDWKLHIKRLTADTLTLVVRGKPYKDGRVDVGYTFTH